MRARATRRSPVARASSSGRRCPSRCARRWSTPTATSTSTTATPAASRSVTVEAARARGVGRRHAHRAGRLRPAERALVGARWRTSIEHVVATVALHPNEAPRIHAAGGEPRSTTALRRDRRARRRPARARRSARPGSTSSAPARRAAPCRSESFRRHIGLAKRLGKPVLIHDRDAHDDVLRVLDDEGAPDDRGVPLLLAATRRWRGYCAEHGWYLSFAGTVTFKNATALREAVAVAPLAPAARRDRRAVPHPDAVPRSPERVLPRAAHGGHARPGAGQTGRGRVRLAVGERDAGVRTVLTRRESGGVKDVTAGGAIPGRIGHPGLWTSDIRDRRLAARPGCLGRSISISRERHRVSVGSPTTDATASRWGKYLVGRATAAREGPPGEFHVPHHRAS